MARQSKIKMLLVDDHFLVREGIRSSLQHSSTLAVVGEAANGRACLEMLEKLKPDVVLMDINMPDMSGLEAIPIIRKRFPAAKVIALTVHDSRHYVLQILRSGAHGYLLKDTSPEELETAIHAVMAGNAFFSPSVSRLLLQTTVADGRATSARSAGGLTPREEDVARLVTQGKTSKEIADALGLSVRTVETHRLRLMRKLNVRNSAELTKYALERGFLPPTLSGAV